MEPETQQAIQNLQRQIDDLNDPAKRITGDHFHNGNDFSRINFSNIYQKKVWIHHTIQGTNAATTANYSTFWITPIACYVNSFREVHAVAGTDGGSVTVQLEKLTGNTVPGSGSSVLTTALSLKSAINTVQNGTLTPTLPNKTLAVGDRLALKAAGVLTAVANVTVLVEIIVL